MWKTAKARSWQAAELAVRGGEGEASSIRTAILLVYERQRTNGKFEVVVVFWWRGEDLGSDVLKGKEL